MVKFAALQSGSGSFTKGMKLSKQFFLKSPLATLQWNKRMNDSWENRRIPDFHFVRTWVEYIYLELVQALLSYWCWLVDSDLKVN